MNATLRFGQMSLAGIIFASLFACAAFGQNPARRDFRSTKPFLINDRAASQEGDRKRMQDAYDQGNFKDAYEGFRKLALEPQNDRRVGDDLHMAIQCLQRLNRIDEIDALLEDVIKVHQDNWRLLWRAAGEYIAIPDQGFIVAGKFYRGPHRGGGGKVVNAAERDRVRALQLMVQAKPLALKDDNHADVGNYLLALANMLLNNRGYSESWRLQYLTDLSVLPDYEDGWGFYRQTTGAPVDADGKPIFYHVPKSFEAAATDGERWRWCLAESVEMNPQQRSTVQMQLAEFLLNQFGVQTMAQSGWRFGRMETDDTQADESGTYALHTLTENETIARLATGIKRFALPDEFNYIKIFQQVAAEPRNGSAIAALERLAQIFENRRQYPQAAAYWRRLLKEFSGTVDAQVKKGWQQRLDQIVGNWGRFEPVQTQAAEKGATVEYRFRNGHEIQFIAHEIKVAKLLDDVKALLKSNPRNLDWRKINIGNIGYRLVQENQKQYVGREVARWQMKVEPREKHFDARVTVATPLQQPGAYLVEAKMADGNTSFIVLWVDDTAIVKKPLSGKTYYYVADAVSGKPIAKANVEFFGWRQFYHNDPPRNEVVTKQFAEFSDASGQVITQTEPPRDDQVSQAALPYLQPQRALNAAVSNQPQEYQWLVTAH